MPIAMRPAAPLLLIAHDKAQSMSSLKMYEIVEVRNPSHPRHGTRGVIAGILVADGEIMGCSVRFVEATEMLDPEDLESTDLSMTEADFERGPWPPAALGADNLS